MAGEQRAKGVLVSADGATLGPHGGRMGGASAKKVC